LSGRHRSLRTSVRGGEGGLLATIADTGGGTGDAECDERDKGEEEDGAATATVARWAIPRSPSPIQRRTAGTAMPSGGGIGGGAGDAKHDDLARVTVTCISYQGLRIGS